MRIPFYQVNAFTHHFRGGNPAGVCLLEDWPEPELMREIAAENGYSETAFLVPEGAAWGLRWFTPGREMDLCGHATMAAAHVLMRETEAAGRQVTFHTRSGELTVARDGDDYRMDLPALPGQAADCPPVLARHFHRTPVAVRKAAKYLLVFDDADYIRSLRPDMAVFKQVQATGVIITAPGDDAETDFVSRFFAGPGLGLDEDPVTGSAHCTLAPYWGEVLGKTELVAEQLSQRGGRLRCRLQGERVLITGSAVTYIAGTLRL